MAIETQNSVYFANCDTEGVYFYTILSIRRGKMLKVHPEESFSVVSLKTILIQRAKDTISAKRHASNNKIPLIEVLLVII